MLWAIIWYVWGRYNEDTESKLATVFQAMGRDILLGSNSYYPLTDVLTDVSLNLAGKNNLISVQIITIH